MATAFDLYAAQSGPVRAEARTETIRIVEYAGFPRTHANHELRVGFTRDISKSGVCLGVDHPEPVGSLLRLGIRSLDGARCDDRIGRVAWSSDERDGRHWMGIELLTDAASRPRRPGEPVPTGGAGPRE